MQALRVTIVSYLQPMDIYEVRRLNLERLIARSYDGRNADFAAATGISPSYVSRMLKPDGDARKRVGETMARNIEDTLRLGRGWLDQPHGRAEGAPAPTSPPLAAVLTELARSIAASPRLQRLQLATLLPLLATEPDSRHETCAAIMRVLAPEVRYTYTATWEETARDVARLAGDRKPTLTPAEFLDAIDKAHAKGVKLAAVPLLKSS